MVGLKGAGGGCTHVMNACSRMTIDPRIPTMPGRSSSGFTDQTGIACTKRENAVRCSASRVKGELHPTKAACEADFLAYGWQRRT